MTDRIQGPPLSATSCFPITGYYNSHEGCRNINSIEYKRWFLRDYFIIESGISCNDLPNKINPINDPNFIPDLKLYSSVEDQLMKGIKAKSLSAYYMQEHIGI